MIISKIITFVFTTFFLLEIVIYLLIQFLNKKIPWVISSNEEFPEFKKKKIENFIEKTFDKLLGWNWKPNTKHQEKIFSKTNKIFFGDLGERKNIRSQKKINFASFGDSFVFCRYVKDNETWQEQLSKLTPYKGLNFGVGNYGLDQVYLKYATTKLPKTVKNIFIGFVPETLSRCLCSWKHYHEFNNIYAFKPKFIISKNKLKLIENPIKGIKSFEKVKYIIKKLRKIEFFYQEKFIKYKLSFPYTFSILKEPKYNLKLFYYSLLKRLNINSDKIYEFIIKNNCEANDNYYLNKKKFLIIKQIMKKIIRNSKNKNHKVYFLIFPQKYDLSLEKKNYKKFFSSLKKKYNIIDFTEIFEKHNKDKIYLPDKYGGHLSVYGNRIVAKILSDKNLIELNVKRS